MGFRSIRHQQQPCPLSCVSACVAMILDIPVARVVEEFHDAYRAGDITPREYLTSLGVGCHQVYGDSKLLFGPVYFLGVPSLNLDGTMHCILLDGRPESTRRVYDPNHGKEGKRYYIEIGAQTTNPLERPLTDFSIEFSIWAAASLGWVNEELKKFQ